MILSFFLSTLLCRYKRPANRSRKIQGGIEQLRPWISGCFIYTKYISVKYLSPATSTAILRCPRASFRLVWSALTYMSHVPSTNGDTSQKRPNGGRERGCVFRVLRVSGTMKKAEEEAIRRARREIVRIRGVEERGVLGDLVSGAGGVKDLVMKGVVDVSDDEMEDED